MNASEYIRQDARYLEIFKASMRDYNSMFMKKMLEIYGGFEGLKSLVDVGDGDGTILNLIASNYPAIKDTNFDLAQIIEKSPSYPGCTGWFSGSRNLHGFPLEQWMLHSWDNEHCLKLLKNCYEALPGHGKVIAVDLVVLESPETSVAVKSVLQFDLYMMNMTEEKKGRRGNWRVWQRQRGFPV
ncbi:hypothetical protein LguiB_034917 [Lonicera macranthoides]